MSAVFAALPWSPSTQSALRVPPSGTAPLLPVVSSSNSSSSPTGPTVPTTYSGTFTTPQSEPACLIASPDVGGVFSLAKVFGHCGICDVSNLFGTLTDRIGSQRCSREPIGRKACGMRARGPTRTGYSILLSAVFRGTPSTGSQVSRRRSSWHGSAGLRGGWSQTGPTSTGTPSIRYSKEMIARSRELKLRLAVLEDQARQEFAVLLTVQAMNSLHSGGHRVLFL
jgi:hypothetical protein